MNIIENGHTNTLCPYLAKPLTSIHPTNKEHVFPVALGAPESFSVEASLSENDRLNTLVDAPVTNDPLVKFLCMITEIKTRSGVVEGTLEGTTQSGEKFTANVNKNTVTLKHRNPVIKDKVTKKTLGARGFADGAFLEADRLIQGLAAKNRELPPEGMIIEEHSLNQNMSFTSDLLLLRREAIKTAYLLTVKAFGDHAINSKSGRIFRAAIEASTNKALEGTGLLLRNLPADHYKFDPPMSTNHHLFMTALDDDQLFTQVIFFGGISFAFSTPRDDIYLENTSFGKLVDASRRCFINNTGE